MDDFNFYRPIYNFGKIYLDIFTGQKSRVAFAVLCAKEPNFIVLDEPTNHLDMETIETLGKGMLLFCVTQSYESDQIVRRFTLESLLSVMTGGSGPTLRDKI